jgi:Glycosyl transferases group 1
LPSAVPIRRILVTVPPRAWFHGISYKLFEIYRQALLDLGCTLFEIPIDTFVPADAGCIATLLDDIRAFAPELAIGLHNGSTALHCRLPAGRDGWRPHLFTEVLDLPTIFIWDHAPLELADQLLMPLPEHPSGSQAGAMAALRRTFTHPRLLHCARDTGQIRIMRALGLVAGDAVVHLPPQALPGFAPPTDRAGSVGEPDVSFIGHLYQGTVDDEPELAALGENIIRHWSPGSALWDVALDHIAMLDAAPRKRLALDPDQTFFWRFMHRLIDHRAQTHRRLAVLGAVGTRVGFYGNLRSNAPGVPDNLVSLREDEVAFGPELASVFARHKITIDVLSPGFVDGYSFKPVNGFASGGFVLVDRKRDFVTAFGEAGAAVSYTDGEDLATKVDHFLSHPNQRLELAAGMRAQIAAGHTLQQFFARLLCAADEHFAGSRPPQPRTTAQVRIPRGTATGLLRSLTSQPWWPGARVEHADSSATVITSPQAWTYAAEIPVPSRAKGVQDRVLELTLQVEAGRLGVAPLALATGELLGEQLVSATRAPVVLTIHLPDDGELTLILRNTVEGSTRATILQASLRQQTRRWWRRR